MIVTREESAICRKEYEGGEMEAGSGGGFRVLAHPRRRRAKLGTGDGELTAESWCGTTTPAFFSIP